MNEEMRRCAAELRTKSSGEAADWLLTRYPAEGAHWGEALTLLEHVSLRKNDVRKLASNYLKRSPFAQDRPYRLFAKLLGLEELLSILLERLPTDQRGADLLLYHLRPMLDAAETDEECRAASEFLAALQGA
jgi:hypothetical protein